MFLTHSFILLPSKLHRRADVKAFKSWCSAALAILVQFELLVNAGLV